MVAYHSDIPNPYEEPHALVTLEFPLSVEGEMALEIFSGEQMVTVGLRPNRVLCFVHWDTNDSPKFDVLLNGN